MMLSSSAARSYRYISTWKVSFCDAQSFLRGKIPQLYPISFGYLDSMASETSRTRIVSKMMPSFLISFVQVSWPSGGDV